jgi:glucose-1-phosphate thymidylyltransferase
VSPNKAVVLAHSGCALVGPAARSRRSSLPPAPLLPVANRALLGHALGWLAQAGVREAAVVVSQELADQARIATADLPRGLRTTWLELLPGETLPDVLAPIMGFLAGEPFVFHLADSVAKQSLRSLTAGTASGELEALLVVDESHQVELAQVVQLRAVAGDCGRPRHRPLSHNGAGVAVLNAQSFEAVAELDVAPGHVLDALSDRIVERGGRVGTRGVTEWWRYRGGTDAVLEGNRFALEGQRPDHDHAHLVDSSIQGAVIAHPQATIEDSIVRGPAIVGAGAHLRHAYVGPYTSVGEDVLIEGTEIEHSVILPGASISHLGGRLEASVIGPRSKVFRDFRLPRALRLTIGEGAEVCLT